MKQAVCPHKGEYPEKERLFSFRRQEFTWRLIGIDADTLCVECTVCGWRQLVRDIDRLSFFFGGGEGYLPRHP